MSEELEPLWNKWRGLLLSTFKGHPSEESVNNLLDVLGERIITTPLHRFEHEIGCKPGGMVEHTLFVAQQASRLMEAYDLHAGMKKSLVRVALLHELGKVGDLENDYLVPEQSSWHREKLGRLYDFNPAEGIQRMTVSHRTLFLLQHFGVQLDQDEWLAVQLASGFHFEENRWYVHKEPELAMLLQQAKHFVLRTFEASK